jgi:hypothetical protein
MKLSDIEVVASNQISEHMAQKTQVDGMVAENKIREDSGRSTAYSEDSFNIIATRMRALKV